MLRASSFLSLSAVVALAAAAPALELPVIVNGTQVVQAPKPPAANPPEQAKGKPPVIINYPSALQSEAAKPGNGKGPVIITGPAIPHPAKAFPARVAVAYNSTISDYMTPVAYNAYGYGQGFGGYAGGLGYGMYDPYTAGVGSYGGYGFGGFGYGGYGYGGFVLPANAAVGPFGPWGYGYTPPLVNVLDTGVRANVGHLVSMPAIAAPVFGDVAAVYYR